MAEQYTEDEQRDRLIGIRDNIITLIGQVTSKPKPNYDIDGQKVDWGDYLEILYKAKAKALQDIIDFEGPYEIETQAYV
jgi:hypothetical protein